MGSPEPYSDALAQQFLRDYCDAYSVDEESARLRASAELSDAVDLMLAGDRRMVWFATRLMLSNATWSWGEMEWICEMAFDWKELDLVVDALRLLSIIKTKGNA